jgi:hypothetical protein
MFVRGFCPYFWFEVVEPSSTASEAARERM